MGLLQVIVNPVAGKIARLNAVERVTSILRERGIEHCLTMTARPGQAGRIAAEAAKAGRDVVVLGGDGTVSEAAAGMIDTGRVFYIAPCGTGNDFIKALRLPADPEKALIAQLDGRVRAVDAGMMNDRCFVNVCGTGFDVEVLRQTERFKKNMSGLMPYLLGIVTALGKYRPPEMTVAVNGETIKKPLTIIAVANGQYIGGGMRVSPRADTTDGLMDVTWVDGMIKPKMCALIPTFIPGWFASLRCAHTVRAKELVIERKGMTVDVDGELIDTDRAVFRTLPGALRMSLPG